MRSLGSTIAVGVMALLLVLAATVHLFRRLKIEVFNRLPTDPCADALPAAGAEQCVIDWFLSPRWLLAEVATATAVAAAVGWLIARAVPAHRVRTGLVAGALTALLALLFFRPGGTIVVAALLGTPLGAALRVARTPPPAEDGRPG